MLKQATLVLLFPDFTASSKKQTGKKMATTNISVILTLAARARKLPRTRTKRKIRREKKKKKKKRTVCISACEMTLLNEVNNHCELIYLAVH